MRRPSLWKTSRSYAWFQSIFSQLKVNMQWLTEVGMCKLEQPRHLYTVKKWRIIWRYSVAQNRRRSRGCLSTVVCSFYLTESRTSQSAGGSLYDLRRTASRLANVVVSNDRISGAAVSGYFCITSCRSAGQQQNYEFIRTHRLAFEFWFHHSNSFIPSLDSTIFGSGENLVKVVTGTVLMIALQNRIT